MVPHCGGEWQHIRINPSKASQIVAKQSASADWRRRLQKLSQLRPRSDRSGDQKSFRIEGALRFPAPAFLFVRICRFLAALPRKVEGAGVAIYSCGWLLCARAVNLQDDRWRGSLDDTHFES